MLSFNEMLSERQLRERESAKRELKKLNREMVLMGFTPTSYVIDKKEREKEKTEARKGRNRKTRIREV